MTELRMESCNSALGYGRCKLRVLQHCKRVGDTPSLKVTKDYPRIYNLAVKKILI